MTHYEQLFDIAADNYVPVENDLYAEAVALVGGGRLPLRGGSVLATLRFAPTNPTRFFVATSKRVRRVLPVNVKVVATPEDVEPTDYEGVPAEPGADAIFSFSIK